MKKNVLNLQVMSNFVRYTCQSHFAYLKRTFLDRLVFFASSNFALTNLFFVLFFVFCFLFFFFEDIALTTFMLIGLAILMTANLPLVIVSF